MGRNKLKINTQRLFQTVIKERYYYLTEDNCWIVLDRVNGKLKISKVRNHLKVYTYNSPALFKILRSHLGSSDFRKVQEHFAELFI